MNIQQQQTAQVLTAITTMDGIGTAFKNGLMTSQEAGEAIIAEAARLMSEYPNKEAAGPDNEQMGV